MQSQSIDFSLVVPCFNEAGHLENSIREVSNVLEFSKCNWEVIFVDDKSPDETVAVAHRIRQWVPNCTVIEKPKNEGRGAAVRDGVHAARGRVVGFIDIDLEVSALYLPSMIRPILSGTADVVTGLRTIRFDPTLYGALRHLLSIGYRWLFRWVTGLPIQDPETGYKLFNRNALLRILDQATSPGWFWDTEVMSYSYVNGLRILEVPCLFIRRHDKKSTIRVLSYTIRQFSELMRFGSKIRDLKSQMKPTSIGALPEFNT